MRVRVRAHASERCLLTRLLARVHPCLPGILQHHAVVGRDTFACVHLRVPYLLNYAMYYGPCRIKQRYVAFVEILPVNSNCDIASVHPFNLYCMFVCDTQWVWCMHIQGTHLLEVLQGQLDNETEDTMVRQNILGTLQKLSLRRPVQRSLIQYVVRQPLFFKVSVGFAFGRASCANTRASSCTPHVLY